jgi:hypothetical protein
MCPAIVAGWSPWGKCLPGFALETFLNDARVDMQTVAAQLDVSPATLYRWFGSRG